METIETFFSNENKLDNKPDEQLKSGLDNTKIENTEEKDSLIKRSIDSAYNRIKMVKDHLIQKKNEYVAEFKRGYNHKINESITKWEAQEQKFISRIANIRNSLIVNDGVYSVKDLVITDAKLKKVQFMLNAYKGGANIDFNAHPHQCEVCGDWYMHTHRYTDLDHKQFKHQCYKTDIKLCSNAQALKSRVASHSFPDFFIINYGPHYPDDNCVICCQPLECKTEDGLSNLDIVYTWCCINDKEKPSLESHPHHISCLAEYFKSGADACPMCKIKQIDPFINMVLEYKDGTHLIKTEEEEIIEPIEEEEHTYVTNLGMVYKSIIPAIIINQNDNNFPAFANNRFVRLYTMDFSTTYNQEVFKILYAHFRSFVHYDLNTRTYSWSNYRSTKMVNNHEHPWLATLRQMMEAVAIEDSKLRIYSSGENFMMDVKIISIAGNPWRLSKYCRELFTTKPVITQNDTTRRAGALPDNVTTCDCMSSLEQPVCLHLIEHAYIVKKIEIPGRGMCGYIAMSVTNSNKLSNLTAFDLRIKDKNSFTYKDSTWFKIYTYYHCLNEDFKAGFKHLKQHCVYHGTHNEHHTDYFNSADWSTGSANWYYAALEEDSWIYKINDYFKNTGKPEKQLLEVLTGKSGFVNYNPPLSYLHSNSIAKPDKMIFYDASHYSVISLTPRKDILVLNTDIDYYEGAKAATDYLACDFKTYSIYHYMEPDITEYKIVEAKTTLYKDDGKFKAIFDVNGNIKYSHELILHNVDADNSVDKMFDGYLYRKTVKSVSLADNHTYRVMTIMPSKNILKMESADEKLWLKNYGSLIVKTQYGTITYTAGLVQYNSENGETFANFTDKKEITVNYNVIKKLVPSFMKKAHLNLLTTISGSKMNNSDRDYTIEEIIVAALLAQVYIIKLNDNVVKTSIYQTAQEALKNTDESENTILSGLQKLSRSNEYEYKTHLVPGYGEGALAYLLRVSLRHTEYYGQNLSLYLLNSILMVRLLKYRNFSKLTSCIIGIISAKLAIIVSSGYRVKKLLNIKEGLLSLFLGISTTAIMKFAKIKNFESIVSGMAVSSFCNWLFTKTHKQVYAGGHIECYGAKNLPDKAAYNKLRDLGSQIVFDKNLDNKTIEVLREDPLKLKLGFVEYDMLQSRLNEFKENRKRDIFSIGPRLIKNTYPTTYASTDCNLYTATARFYSKVPKFDQNSLIRYENWVNNHYIPSIKEKLYLFFDGKNKIYTEWLENQKSIVRTQLSLVLSTKGIIEDKDTIQNQVKTDELYVDYEEAGRPRLIMAPTVECKYLCKFKWEVLKIMARIDSAIFSGLNWDEMSKRIELFNNNHPDNEEYGDGDSSMFETTQHQEIKQILLPKMYEAVLEWLGPDFYIGWKELLKCIPKFTTHITSYSDKQLIYRIKVCGKTNSGNPGTTIENSELNASYLRYWGWCLGLKETVILPVTNNIIEKGDYCFGVIGDDYLLKTDKDKQVLFQQNMGIVYTDQRHDGGLGQVYKGVLKFTKYPDFISVDLITRSDNSVRIIRKINRWLYTIPWSKSINVRKYSKDMMKQIKEMAWAIGMGHGWAKYCPIINNYAVHLIKYGSKMNESDYKLHLFKHKWQQEPRQCTLAREEDYDLILDLWQDKYNMDKFLIQAIDRNLLELEELQQELDYDFNSVFTTSEDYAERNSDINLETVNLDGELSLFTERL